MWSVRTRSTSQQHFFDVLARSEMLHSARTDTNILEAAMRSFRSLLLTISYEIAALPLAMTILFKGIPFCTRPETGILEGVMLPAIVRNDTGLFENDVKKMASFSGSHFFKS
jgi:hypothetical protein